MSSCKQEEGQEEEVVQGRKQQTHSVLTEIKHGQDKKEDRKHKAPAAAVMMVALDVGARYLKERDVLNLAAQ